MIFEHDLIARLEELGDQLALDDRANSRLADDVLTRIAQPKPQRSQPLSPRRRAAAVAAALVVVCGGALAFPDARHAMARWFGLDAVGVRIEPDLFLPPPPSAFDAPGPGASRVVVVDGRQVQVSAVSGALDEMLVMKTVGSSDQLQQVDVNGHLGLWVDGAPHEVMYRAPSGDVVVKRVAGNTLLWQVGDVLYRVEGLPDLADALAFAGNLTGT